MNHTTIRMAVIISVSYHTGSGYSIEDEYYIICYSWVDIQLDLLLYASLLFSLYHSGSAAQIGTK